MALLDVSFALGQPNPVDFYRFEPLVISRDVPTDVILEVKMSTTPSRVVLVDATTPSRVFELRDDGTGGDRIAADQIYSIKLQGSQIASQLREEDVFRVLVGFLDIYEGPSRVLRGNLVLDVITSDVSRPPVVRDSNTVQHTANLVNIMDRDYFLDRDIRRITRTFYSIFPDEFDFIAIVSSVARFQNRFHILLQNQVQGIGLAQFDNTDFYGSQGRLLGINVFPIPTFFDGAESGYQHEMGHQWINFLSFAPLGQGVPHWPISSMASGIMGWTGVGGQGSRFPCLLVPEPDGVRLRPRREEAVFSDFDLYLMGLLDSSGVEPGFVFAEQGLDAADSIIAQCDGRIYEGELEKFTVDQLIAQEGPRVPTASVAPKHFKIANIIVSHDRLLNENEMALYSLFSRRAEARKEVLMHFGLIHAIAKPFYVSTRGLGSLSTRVPAATCSEDASTLCLNEGRFRVRANFESGAGAGSARVVKLTDETGYLWFFTASNVEVVVKIINGCALNERFWVFAGGLTNVRTILTVMDTHSGDIKTYATPQGTPFQPLQDTNAFATCP